MTPETPLCGRCGAEVMVSSGVPVQGTDRVVAVVVHGQDSIIADWRDGADREVQIGAAIEMLCRLTVSALEGERE